MEIITVADIMTATGGLLLSGSMEQTVNEVETDSRTIHEGSLFVPLVGEKFDGHAYISKALAAGAAGTLTEHAPETMEEGKFYIQVADTMKALGDLAHYYRRQFNVKVVAVTGSVGKTTSKDMLYSVLSEKFNVLKTEGNFNNNIGVPKTLFRLNHEHEVAVVEMGMNHMGEIDYLTRMAEPDVAVITNVGDAHIENLGCRENTLKAKSEVFNGMTAKGLAVLNGDDALLSTLKGRLEQQILWYGAGEGCDFRCLSLDEGYDDHMVMQVSAPQDQWEQTIPGLGAYMMFPVLAASAVGSWLGMTPAEIRQGVVNFVPTKMRMDIVRRKDGIVILNDTYNANPQSMRAAVDVLAKFRGGYKVAVLGDMLELGTLGPALHEGVGRFVGQCGIDCLIAVGELAESIYNAASQFEGVECYHRPTKEEAAVILDQIIRPDAVFLCKASRGMHMEELVEHLKKITE